MTRILITGSRVWKDKAAILAALVEQLPTCSWPVTIVHGAQKRWDHRGQRFIGADFYADEIAREVGLEVDPHPADWDRYGKAAGPIRNREMVATLDATNGDRVLAFPIRDSRGTRGCMAIAEEAGIPVINKGIDQKEKKS
jgi:hypothetical protein